MLLTYMQRTQQLLFDLRQELINPLFLTGFVNTARGQVAGESGCIRVIGAAQTVAASRQTLFSAITLGLGVPAGIAGTVRLHQLLYGVGSGYKLIAPRAWEWFTLYSLNNPVPPSGPPTSWAQLGQGVDTGSFWLDPVPDLAYSLICDCICSPTALVNDTTPEAIPFPWTDAIPYFAAYLAYLSAQQPDRARIMLDLYKTFAARARQMSTPTVVGYLYQDAPDPVQVNKIAVPGRGE